MLREPDFPNDRLVAHRKSTGTKGFLSTGGPVSNRLVEGGDAGVTVEQEEHWDRVQRVARLRDNANEMLDGLVEKFFGIEDPTRSAVVPPVNTK